MPVNLPPRIGASFFGRAARSQKTRTRRWKSFVAPTGIRSMPTSGATDTARTTRRTWFRNSSAGFSKGNTLGTPTVIVGGSALFSSVHSRTSSSTNGTSRIAQRAGAACGFCRWTKKWPSPTSVRNQRWSSRRTPCTTGAGRPSCWIAPWRRCGRSSRSQGSRIYCKDHLLQPPPVIDVILLHCCGGGLFIPGGHSSSGLRGSAARHSITRMR